MPQQEKRGKIAEFNRRMQPIYDLLQRIDAMKLTPEQMQPDPFAGLVDAKNRLSLDDGTESGRHSMWSNGEFVSRGRFGTDDIQVRHYILRCMKNRIL